MPMTNGQPKGAKGNILVVDDDLHFRQTLEALLTGQGYEVRCAASGGMALMFGGEDPPDLILLDIRLPDMDGFEVCRRLREDSRTDRIPVIFISGPDEVVDKVKGFPAGGLDYLTKPVQGEEVLARVEMHLRLRCLQKQSEAQNAQLQQEIIRSNKAEEKIKRAAQEWRTTFDSIQDPVSIHDKDFRIVRTNKAFAAAFGMEIKELLGKKCHQIIHATEAPWPNCPHRQSLESGKPVTEEFFEPRLGRYLQVSASPISNDQNEVIGSVHITKDITGQKQIEEVLKASETRYRRLFEAAQDGIFILDADTERITDVNPFLVEMLGYSQADFLGKKIWEMGAFKDIEASKAAFSELQTKGYVRYEDLPLQTQDGRLIDVEFVSNVYIVNHHKVIQCNIRDITIRKRAEEVLRKAHDELEERVKTRAADLSRANEQLAASEASLEERLRFGTLLAEISSRFVNLPSDQIDGEIEGAQYRICEFLDLDRSSLWQVSAEDPETLLLTHFHHPSGSLSPPERMNAGDFFPWTAQKVLDGEMVTISKMTDLPPEAGRDRENFRAYGTKSDVLVPLSVGEGPVFGLLTFSVIREERSWPKTVVMGFKLIAQVFANALARKRADEQFKRHVGEIEELKKRLERENIYLREEVELLVEHTEIVGQSLPMKKVLSQAEQVARTDSTVLILGETGTGKELLARAIHKMSARKDRPLITVNCASLAPTLIESELFGREKGAYTGAMTRMIGRFEIADGSTLFLDEVGEIPLELQSKLLRVLEEGNFERLGSTKTLHVNVRIIAATNRDIEQEVKDG